MDRLKGRFFLSAVFLALAFFCLLLAFSAYQTSQRESAWITAILEQKRTASDYGKMAQLEEEAANPVPFALWKEEKRQNITDALSGRNAEATALYLRGDLRAVLPTSAALALGDTEGCLLDKKTGEKLFGKQLPIGVTLLLDGKEYAVRGYFDSPQSAVVFALGEKDERELNRVSAPGGEQGKAFMDRQGFSGKNRLSGERYQQWAAFLLAIPFLFLLIYGFACLFRFRSRVKAYPFRWILWMIGLFLFTAFFLWLFLFLLPKDLFPSQWADFSFWKKNFPGWEENLSWAGSMETGIQDMWSRRLAFRVAFGIPAGVLIPLFLKMFFGGQRKTPGTISHSQITTT